MSSSVSSERTFSQGGITINKQWNRLKGDIVEALQCIKCAIQHDLLFREPSPSSVLEAEVNEANDGAGDLEEDEEEGSETAEPTWDDMIIDDEDEAMGTDFD
jgi:hAT family C-terminal dimerisation region